MKRIVFLRILLSLVLCVCLFFFHVDYCYAASPITYSAVGGSGQSLSAPLLYVSVFSETEYRYNFTSNPNSTSYLTSNPYYNRNVLTFDFNASCSMPVGFFDPNAFTIPSGYDHMSGYFQFKVSNWNSLGASTGYRVTDFWLDIYGVSSSHSAPDANNNIYFFVEMDVSEGTIISSNRTLLCYSASEWVDSGDSIITKVYNPSFTITPVAYNFTLTSSGLVTSQDVTNQTTQINQQIQQQTQQQTESLQTGFDSSSGDDAADQLAVEVNDYLKTEDALYDQMKYDVPEVDIVSDGQAIMLASNFMQGLYVSDSFISKCVTFVLTFGLIMYIVGYLKKSS